MSDEFGVCPDRTEGPGSWIAEVLHPFATDVGSLIPPIYSHYARLFHPASRFVDDRQIAVTWKEVAAITGSSVHPEMQWSNISGQGFPPRHSAPGLWDDEPERGRLPKQWAPRLAELLKVHTSSLTRVWFGIWDGWGDGQLLTSAIRMKLSQQGSMREGHRQERAPIDELDLPYRRYLLIQSAIEDITMSLSDDAYWLTASMWWPEDRSWFVHTEVDLASTYVGGTKACLLDVLGETSIESLPTTEYHRISWDSDQANSRP